MAQPPFDPDSVEQADSRSAMAKALSWASHIMTISAGMVFPGLVGYWLDLRFGTRALFLLLGFALGAVLAALSLRRIIRQAAAADRSAKADRNAKAGGRNAPKRHE